MSWGVRCCGHTTDAGENDHARCVRCAKVYDRPANNFDGLVSPQNATPAERYEQVRAMLNPPDGSEPLISRERALDLLGASDIFTPAARPVKVDEHWVGPLREDRPCENKLITDACKGFARSPEPYDDLGYIVEHAAAMALDPWCSTLARDGLTDLLKATRGLQDAALAKSEPTGTPESTFARIAELEQSIREHRDDTRFVEEAHDLEKKMRLEADERANRLSDKAGSLATELREAHETIGRQAREIERLQRVAGGKK